MAAMGTPREIREAIFLSGVDGLTEGGAQRSPRCKLLRNKQNMGTSNSQCLFLIYYTTGNCYSANNNVEIKLFLV